MIRAWPQLVADILLESFAGLLVGILYTHIGFNELTKFIFIANLALGLTISIASLRVFGKEKVVYWREAAPGAGMNLNKFAYFMAKNAVELPRLLLLTFFFVMSFYPIVTPTIQWWQFVGYAAAGSFACSGLAYFASVALDPLTAQLVTVIWVRPHLFGWKIPLTVMIFRSSLRRCSPVCRPGWTKSLSLHSFPSSLT